MRATQATLDPITAWIKRLAGEPLREASIERKALAGGLEAPEVALVTARYRDGSNRRRMLRFVLKRLAGRVREAAAYERLAVQHAADVSPRLLGVEHAAPVARCSASGRFGGSRYGLAVELLAAGALSRRGRSGGARCYRVGLRRGPSRR